MAARSLPLLGDLLAFRADRLRFLTDLQRRHGDVAPFRIGPYRVWQLSHPDHVADVLVAAADRFRKGPILQRARLVLGDGLLTSEADTHRADRRVLQRAFHPRRVDGYAEVMVSQATAVADRWMAGSVVDVHASTVRATLATASTTLLGEDVEVTNVEAAIADLLSAYRLAFLPFGWRLQHVPIGPVRRLRRGRATLHELVDRMMVQRRTDGVDRGDLLSALVLDDEGARWPDEHVRDHAVTLLLAGHETTANALAFACHLLATHPTVQERVQAEVDTVLGRRPPTAGDVERLPSCRAVIAESLRLFPPSWAIGRQARTDHRVERSSVRLAAGDLVIVPPWVVHRDPRWWPRPSRCDPDRWLAHSDERPRWAYLPFGAGVRRCIGEGFAWTEGVLALAVLAQRWRFTPVPEQPLRLEPLITLRPRDGLWLRVDAR